VHRRYTDFFNLLSSLQSIYTHIKEPFPELPPKDYITPKDDINFIKERKIKLNIFLDELLKTMHIERILDNHYLADFLDFKTFNTKSIYNRSSIDNYNSDSGRYDSECDTKISVQTKSILTTTTNSLSSSSGSSSSSSSSFNAMSKNVTDEL
jgi:hypothetical protein